MVGIMFIDYCVYRLPHAAGGGGSHVASAAWSSLARPAELRLRVGVADGADANFVSAQVFVG